ncbi:MAG TPA: DUF3618 domain-containing protein [Kineosporiaceae bacterium]|nr:DUF3618 domain-containing protein [Kineosporiaceae bacterium]
MSTDPDQIRADIERTRNALSSDVTTLAETVRPGQVARRQAGRLRGALGSARERIMGSPDYGPGPMSSARTTTAQTTTGRAVSGAQEAVGQAADTVQQAAGRVQEAVSSAPETMRARTGGNPLAAGMIAFGVGWLAGSLLPASTPERRVAGKVRENVSAVTEPIGETAREVAEHLKEPAQQAAESVKSTAAEGARTVRAEGTSAAQQVRDRGAEAAQAVRGSGQG